VSAGPIRHNNALQNSISPIDVSEWQGSFRGEGVRAALEESVIAKAAAENVGALRIARTNVQELARRVQKEPAVGTAALYESLAAMAELDKTTLPQMLAFLDDLTELLDEGRQEKHGSDEEEQHEERFEAGLYRALRKLNNTADKAMAVAVARGYFEARDANSTFLNALHAVSGEFDEIMSGATLAQLAAAQDATLEAATLETSPAAVRMRYRKRLVEKASLGALFEELVALGLEPGFSSLFADIGADLATVGSQSDRGYLRSLTIELKKLWQLKSVHEETREAVRNTEPHLSKSELRPDLLRLTAYLLHYCAKSTVNASDAQQLLGPLEAASLASQVVFANSLRDLHNRLPDGIWLEATERLLQYDALGTLCHRLTEAEDHFYEQLNQS
jgi:hypothetical protein